MDCQTHLAIVDAVQLDLDLRKLRLVVVVALPVVIFFLLVVALVVALVVGVNVEVLLDVPLLVDVLVGVLLGGLHLLVAVHVLTDGGESLVNLRGDVRVHIPFCSSDEESTMAGLV